MKNNLEKVQNLCEDGHSFFSQIYVIKRCTNSCLLYFTCSKVTDLAVRRSEACICYQHICCISGFYKRSNCSSTRYFSQESCVKCNWYETSKKTEKLTLLAEM